MSHSSDHVARQYALEEHATHPIANAVVQTARERELPHIHHGEVEYLVAHGLSARLPNGRITIGSRHYLEAHLGFDFAPFADRIARFEEEGKALLFVGNAEGPVGLIALRDTPRAETPATLRRIRNNFRGAAGLNTAILARAIAGRLSPLASAALHNGVTVGVLTNALRPIRLAREPEAPL